MYQKINILLSIMVFPFVMLTSAAVYGVPSESEDLTNENNQTISDSIGYSQTDRVEILDKFFEKYKSPLKDNTKTFVEIADKYKIDFRLLPAISCIESSCGKKLIPGSYNPFGWGIYGTNVIRFGSYDEAIAEVGKGLSENYFSKGYDTIEEIAPIYTPPSFIHWRSKVYFFIEEMEKIENDTNLSLARTDRPEGSL